MQEKGISLQEEPTDHITPTLNTRLEINLSIHTTIMNSQRSTGKTPSCNTESLFLVPLAWLSQDGTFNTTVSNRREEGK